MNIKSGAKFIASSNRRFEQVIVFVHHFGGSIQSSSRQQEFFNELGFDSVAFNMTHQTETNTPVNKDTAKAMVRGLRHLWADQVEDVLKGIDRPIVIYSFSMLGGAALEAMARISFQNITAWIADSGPFLSVPQCYWRYMQRFHSRWPAPIKALGVVSSYAAMGIYDYRSSVQNYFNKMPKGFPILSIRSWDDQLVPISAIDDFFALGGDLNIEILSIPEADHLQGLAKSPQDYKPRVEKFIKRVATAEEPRD